MDAVIRKKETMTAAYHAMLRHIPRPMLIKLSIYFRESLNVLFKGNKYTDPINGKSYRRFLPYGQSAIAKRDNVLSPGTLSLERHRLMWLYLSNCTDFMSRQYKVLHIAPEQCFYKLFRKMPNLQYTTADYNSPIADLHFDLHQIPLADELYDVIFCNHVLEHVKDDIRCMEEMYRVMKKGAWGIFQVPIDEKREITLEDETINTPALREKYYWQKDHLRLYGLDYKKRLESVGFEVEVNDYISTLSQEEIARYGLNASEKIYICRKV